MKKQIFLENNTLFSTHAQNYSESRRNTFTRSIKITRTMLSLRDISNILLYISA